jgi:hypothetical protein
VLDAWREDSRSDEWEICNLGELRGMEFSPEDLYRLSALQPICEKFDDTNSLSISSQAQIILKHKKITHYESRREGRLGKVDFTIINYTNQDVAINIRGELYLNGESQFSFGRGGQITVSHPVGRPKELQLIYKDAIGENIVYDFNLGWRRFDRDSSNYIYESVRKERAFKHLWLGLNDPNSCFAKFRIPKELLSLIINLYIRHVQYK